jgi:hypothetical protein
MTMPRVPNWSLSGVVTTIGRARKRASTRLWLELLAAATSSCLLLVTIVWPDWIEIAFGIDPDQGDGSLEWLIIAVMAAVVVASAFLSRMELRRLQEAAV